MRNALAQQAKLRLSMHKILHPGIKMFDEFIDGQRS